MPELSVHDNRLVGYEVDSSARRIVLHTEFRGETTHERTDVVFDGVQGYLMRDNMECVLRGIDEISAEYLLDQFAPELERGRNYGWPGAWNAPGVDVERHLLNARLTAWLVMSESRFDGFVIAERMEMVAR